MWHHIKSFRIIYPCHCYFFFTITLDNNFHINGEQVFFFFYQGFLSQTLTNHGTTGEGRGPSFIPHYHFHPLTNIKTVIFNFGCEITITYFYSQCLCLADCYSMRLTTLSNYHLIDWLMIQCLFVRLMNWF